MTSTSVPVTSSTGSTNAGSVLSSTGGSFSDNPFLKLLTEELKNQTPLEPVDNAAFLNQIASYSTVQSQQDLNANMLKLLDFQGLIARSQGLSQGSALLGKQVDYADESGNTAQGTVDSVFVSETGDVKLKLTSGTEVDLRQVVGISQASAAPAPTPTPSTSAS